MGVQITVGMVGFYTVTSESHSIASSKSDVKRPLSLKLVNALDDIAQMVVDKGIKTILKEEVNHNLFRASIYCQMIDDIR